jgi:hypothetical protein
MKKHPPGIDVAVRGRIDHFNAYVIFSIVPVKANGVL